MRHPLYEVPCAYCGDRATAEDHITPRSKGGILTAPACTRCNSSKGARTPTEWIVALLNRVARGEKRGIDQLHRMMPHIPGLIRSHIVNAKALIDWYHELVAQHERTQETAMTTVAAMFVLDEHCLSDFNLYVAEAEPF